MTVDLQQTLNEMLLKMFSDLLTHFEERLTAHGKMCPSLEATFAGLRDYY